MARRFCSGGTRERAVNSHAGLVWLHDHAQDLGVDPSRIAIMGDSGGGGVAAGLAIHARDNSGPAIARQILIYPMLDDRNVDPDPELVPFATWSYDDNFTGWNALLGDLRGSDEVPASASPSRIVDPAGLPPAYVEVGELDIFRNEDIEYARRLSAAGVSTELHVHPSVPHAWETFAFSGAVAKRSAEDRIRVISSF
ncbi:alpha/beta hydrolase fold domain-containing protein [Subtercola boreus]|nr:alpha/beta hydrolase fold domain-containing protein [Subtercola boreus]